MADLGMAPRVEMGVGAAGLLAGAGVMLSAKPIYDRRYFDHGTAEAQAHAERRANDARRAYMLHQVSPAERSMLEGLEASYRAEVHAVQQLGQKASSRLALGTAIFGVAALPFVDGWLGSPILGSLTGRTD